MKWVVGITGGIGSGKSAVTDRLETHGITVVDADKVARMVVEPGQPALAAIAQHFGTGVLQQNGTLNRLALRKIVFEDAQARQWLEGVTHPAIRDEIQRQLSRASSPYVVLSSPLLLESGQNTFAQYVVVVDVPESLQIARTMARDNNDESLVRAIMEAQLPRDKRCAAADQVISNNGTLNELYAKTDALHTQLLERAKNQPAS